MARSRTPVTPPHAVVTVEQKKLGIIKLQRRLAELDQLDVGAIEGRKDPKVTALTMNIQKTLTELFPVGTVEHGRYDRAWYFDRANYNIYNDTPLHEIQKGVAEGVNESRAIIQAIIQGFTEDLGDEMIYGEAEPRADSKKSPVNNRDVFIVHGHHEATKEAAARTVAALGLKAVILHEQANKGRTIIEKFEAHSDVGFAVVLLTPDDLGASAKTPGELKPRARQNVVMELGFFLGALGRARVCALKLGTVELPSDYDGVTYIELDEKGAWKFFLAKELQSAGYPVDFSRL